MTYRMRDGSTVDDPRLGRLPTGHTTHLDRYPLTTDTMPSTATPVVIGVNWHTNFDTPTRRRIAGRDRWVIGDGNLGPIRGGHAVCLRPWNVTDALGWWHYYDQIKEGRCVEFAWLRALSLLNRRRYDTTSRWHYYEMQRRDYWPGGSYPGATPQYEGTSVDAGGQVIRHSGAIPSRWPYPPVPLEDAPTKVSHADGITAYRWTDWAGARAATRTPDELPGIPMLNSWGLAYPREVLLLDAAGDKLHRDGGEFAVATDR